MSGGPGSQLQKSRTKRNQLEQRQSVSGQQNIDRLSTVQAPQSVQSQQKASRSSQILAAGLVVMPEESIQNGSYAEKFQENMTAEKRQKQSGLLGSALRTKRINAETLEEAQKQYGERLAESVLSWKRRAQEAHIRMEEEELENLAVFGSALTSPLERFVDGSQVEIVKECIADFMNLKLDNLDFKTDKTFAAQSGRMEVILSKTRALGCLIERYPSALDALDEEGKEAFRQKYETAEALSDYYETKRDVITDNYYRTHYNSEISSLYREEDTSEQKRLVLRMRLAQQRLEEMRAGKSQGLFGRLAQEQERRETRAQHQSAAQAAVQTQAEARKTELEDRLRQMEEELFRSRERLEAARVQAQEEKERIEQGYEERLNQMRQDSAFYGALSEAYREQKEVSADRQKLAKEKLAEETKQLSRLVVDRLFDQKEEMKLPDEMEKLVHVEDVHKMKPEQRAEADQRYNHLVKAYNTRENVNREGVRNESFAIGEQKIPTLPLMEQYHADKEELVTRRQVTLGFDRKNREAHLLRGEIKKEIEAYNSQKAKESKKSDKKFTPLPKDFTTLQKLYEKDPVEYGKSVDIIKDLIKNSKSKKKEAMEQYFPQFDTLVRDEAAIRLVEKTMNGEIHAENKKIVKLNKQIAEQKERLMRSLSQEKHREAMAQVNQDEEKAFLDALKTSERKKKLADAKAIGLRWVVGAVDTLTDATKELAAILTTASIKGELKQAEQAMRNLEQEIASKRETIETIDGWRTNVLLQNQQRLDAAGQKAVRTELGMILVGNQEASLASMTAAEREALKRALQTEVEQLRAELDARRLEYPELKARVEETAWGNMDAFYGSGFSEQNAPDSTAIEDARIRAERERMDRIQKQDLLEFDAVREMTGNDLVLAQRQSERRYADRQRMEAESVEIRQNHKNRALRAEVEERSDNVAGLFKKDVLEKMDLVADAVNFLVKAVGKIGGKEEEEHSEGPDGIGDMLDEITQKLKEMNEPDDPDREHYADKILTILQELTKKADAIRERLNVELASAAQQAQVEHAGYEKKKQQYDAFEEIRKQARDLHTADTTQFLYAEVRHRLNTCTADEYLSGQNKILYEKFEAEAGKRKERVDARIAAEETEKQQQKAALDDGLAEMEHEVEERKQELRQFLEKKLEEHAARRRELEERIQREAIADNERQDYCAELQNLSAAQLQQKLEQETAKEHPDSQQLEILSSMIVHGAQKTMETYLDEAKERYQSFQEEMNVMEAEQQRLELLRKEM